MSGVWAIQMTKMSNICIFLKFIKYLKCKNKMLIWDYCSLADSKAAHSLPKSNNKARAKTAKPGQTPGLSHWPVTRPDPAKIVDHDPKTRFRHWCVSASAGWHCVFTFCDSTEFCCVCVFCRPGRLRAVDRVYVVRMAASGFILSRIPAAAILLLCIATVTYLSAVGLMWFLVLKILRVVLSNLCTLSQ